MSEIINCEVKFDFTTKLHLLLTVWRLKERRKSKQIYCCTNHGATFVLEDIYVHLCPSLMTLNHFMLSFSDRSPLNAPVSH